MRIGLVSPYSMHSRGGVQSHIRDLAAALRDIGHQVSILAPRTDGQVDSNGVFLFGQSRRIGFNGTYFDIGAVWGREAVRLQQWFDLQHFDLLHFHTVWNPIFPFQVLMRAQNTATVATFHDLPPATISGWITRQAFKVMSYLLSGRLDAAIAVSKGPAGHLRIKSRRFIIPPCVNLDALMAIPPHARAKTSPPRLLYIGRLEPRKSVGTLLDAVHCLASEGMEVNVIIAGDGVDRDRLEKQAARLNLSNVSFLGAVSENQKIELLKNADVFCAPAVYGESFGVVIVEAMAAGLPVVAAQNTGYADILFEQKDMCLFPVGDFFAMADKIRYLINHPDASDGLRRWGRETARYYDSAIVVRSIVETYVGAIKNRQQRL